MSVHPKGKDKHGNPRWTVVISYKQDGRLRRKAFVVRGTKSEALSREAELKVQLDQGPVKVDASEDKPAAVPTFSDFCVNQYRPSAELRLKHGTWIKRASHLATLISFFGEDHLNEITGEIIEIYMAQRQKQGLKRISINNELRVLRRVLTFANEERGIDFVVPRIRFLKEGIRRPKVWDEAQVQALFEATSQTAPALLPILVCMVNTGLRPGEALALRWDHVDLDAGMLHVWPHAPMAGADTTPDEGWTPKSGKPREVPIADDLRAWLAGRRESKIWVFPSSTGDRFAYWPGHQYLRAQDAAGLNGGVHTLRHTFASHFLQAVPDLFLLAQILGHSQLRVTELYSHLLPGHLDRGRNAVQITPPTSTALKAARQQWRTAGVIHSEPATLAKKPGQP